MKKFFFIILGFVISNLTFAQFSNIKLNDVFSTDSINAWLVGSNGTIVLVTSEGEKWEDHSYSTNLILQSVYFINDNEGFIVGDSGILLKTTDGGNNWNPINLGVTTNFSSVSFVDDQNGWISPNPISGANSGTGQFKTTNGGDDWTYLDHNIFNTQFIDPDNGWGSAFTIVPLLIANKRTYDGGLTWETISTFNGVSYPSFFFLDTLIGFEIQRAYGNSLCYNTISGGINWTRSNLGGEGLILNDIFFLDTLNGWVCGSQQIFYSNDFFDTYNTFWSEGTMFNSFSIHGYSNGWVVSYNIGDDQSSIWKLDSANNWIELNFVGVDERNKDMTEINCFPNPFNESIKIEIKLMNTSEINISVYDKLGKEIESIINGKLKNGKHQFIWCSENYQAGIYFIKVQTKQGISTQKIIKK